MGRRAAGGALRRCVVLKSPVRGVGVRQAGWCWRGSGCTPASSPASTLRPVVPQASRDGALASPATSQLDKLDPLLLRWEGRQAAAAHVARLWAGSGDFTPALAFVRDGGGSDVGVPAGTVGGSASAAAVGGESRPLRSALKRSTRPESMPARSPPTVGDFSGTVGGGGDAADEMLAARAAPELVAGGDAATADGAPAAARNSAAASLPNASRRRVAWLDHAEATAPPSDGVVAAGGGRVGELGHGGDKGDGGLASGGDRVVFSLDAPPATSQALGGHPAPEASGPDAGTPHTSPVIRARVRAAGADERRDGRAAGSRAGAARVKHGARPSVGATASSALGGDAGLGTTARGNASLAGGVGARESMAAAPLTGQPSSSGEWVPLASGARLSSRAARKPATTSAADTAAPAGACRTLHLHRSPRMDPSPPARP